MSLTAADIAQTKVASLSPEAPLVNAHRLFVDEQISGAPVVDDLGQVVGVVSASDLLRSVVDIHDSGRELPGYLAEQLELSISDFDELPEGYQVRLQETVVGDVMTESPVIVEATATIAEVARAMRDAHVHRVIVAKQGGLVGIISTLDLVSLLADGRALD